MRRFVAIALAMLFGFLAGLALSPSSMPATITLTTPFTQGGPNIVAETDPLAAPMGICADQTTKIIRLTIYPATSQTTVAGKSTGITLGVVSPVTLMVSAETGAWSSSNGKSGTLTGNNLIGAQGWLASALTPDMKNQAEAFLIATGVLPGEATFPW